MSPVEKKDLSQRVVITGMGVVSPNGCNLQEFDMALREGRSGIRFIQELNELNFSCQVAGVAKLPEQLPSFFVENELENAANNIQLACLAGMEAYTDAGFSILPKENQQTDWDTGTIIGTGGGGADVLGGKVVPSTNSGNARRIDVYASTNIMASGASAKLSGMLSLGNQSSANSSACCTGTEALLEGYYRIKMGLAKRMLTGSSESYSPYLWAGFNAMRVVNSRSNDSPEKASSPMSNQPFGFVPSSGAGILMLESLESAQARNAKIYAELLGGSINCGGQQNGGSMTFPNPEGIKRCIREAMKHADIESKNIDLINGHLTSTMADKLEVKLWKEVLSETTDHFPYIQSTKSMIGHGLGAAGSMECVATVLQLNGSYVHPSINCKNPHPDILLQINANRIPQQKIDFPELNVAVKSSFAFGDSNCCLFFKKWS